MGFTLLEAVTVRAGAWSCFSDVSTMAGSRYDDLLGLKYSYDTTVRNHLQVRAGDLLIIRDNKLIYGYGVVNEVSQERGTVLMSLCPACLRSAASRRATRSPEYRCSKCGAEFEQPIVKEREVTVFTAWYGASWFPFTSPAPMHTLNAAYRYRDQQNAIRRLEPEPAHAFLRHHAGVEGYLYLEISSRGMELDGGLVDALVKRRVGQQRYREILLDRFGATCAVTGPQPDEILDAAHLYSYAERPVHEEDGGLLLRADMHRLFDRFLLTFDPTTWHAQLSPPFVAAHPSLAAFEETPMAIPAALRPRRRLIERHHRESFARWRVEASP